MDWYEVVISGGKKTTQIFSNKFKIAGCLGALLRMVMLYHWDYFLIIFDRRGKVILEPVFIIFIIIHAFLFHIQMSDISVLV
jgi:hypothetical protein